jgi:hypothetical protein
MIGTLIFCATALLVTAALCVTALRGWNGWLAVRREELAHRRSGDEAGVAVRIELADVRERLRKLEAIASDVDL